MESIQRSGGVFPFKAHLLLAPCNARIVCFFWGGGRGAETMLPMIRAVYRVHLDRRSHRQLTFPRQNRARPEWKMSTTRMHPGCRQRVFHPRGLRRRGQGGGGRQGLASPCRTWRASRTRRSSLGTSATGEARALLHCFKSNTSTNYYYYVQS